MSAYENAISGLKRLNKQDLISFDPTEHASHVLRESDRAAIILVASSIEASLLYMLNARMPSLNAEERSRIFQFEGPCGSFSSRIRIAQAIGLIDRTTRKQVELVKEMRNTAAHCHAAMDYDTPEIRKAVIALYPPKARSMMESWDAVRMRAAFLTFAIRLGSSIAEEQPVNTDELWGFVSAAEPQPRTSHDK